MKNPKRQFEETIMDNIGDLRNTAIECESIADNMAIEFAEWCMKNIYDTEHLKTTNQLLQQFKSEFYK